ncbi:protein FAR1-RELATED SEQUENCE 6-like [Chenopodium quinoa]|uniref:protein FAR1-RELATED SEQUENCE 6-like n=1 Tax=Chenopodium quinoa TaxID=63459 RepID=UPI000B779FC9|nr:protein FAR1-RELATED SEQUENCE 6-like [Chenopodium quinoa]
MTREADVLQFCGSCSISTTQIDLGFQFLQRERENSKEREAGSEYEDGAECVNYSEHFVTDTVFPTFDDAVNWADAVALNLGFVLVISSNCKIRDGRPYRYLRCDRGRKSQPRDLENANRRDTKTKAIGCPFYIKIYYVFVTDSWRIRAKNDATRTHNHPMIVYPEGHRKISGLSPDGKKVVHDMTKSKVAPRNIMATIAEQFPNDHPNIRHIYNYRNDLRAEMFDGRGGVQQFLHLARQSQYLYWVMSDDVGVLQHAFMVHPITVNILRTYPHVMGMDSTYKTNRYGMPFLEIVGVTPTNQNFLVGYVFMRNECTGSYRWVLQRLRELIRYDKEPSVFLTDRELGLCAALREVFPGTSHLLCRWHINKDMEARVTNMFKNKKIGRQFKNGAWKRIMDAATEAHYNSAVDRMKTRWASFPNVISYVERTWLCHKIKFVTFGTNQVMHLGNTSTCRVESQHSAVKMWFESSTGSLDTGVSPSFESSGWRDEKDERAELPGLYTRQIHPFWKTLVIGDSVNEPEFVNDSNEEAAHFRSLVDEVVGSDRAVLRNVSRIIEEELHPDHTNLEEPQVNLNVRGRRRNNDTKCNLSYFEHVDRRNTEVGAQQPGTEDQGDISQCRYLHLLPGPMLPYITAWKDVIGDGNCGFRCVADFFLGDQARWYDAWEIIANEVGAHRNLYERIYGLGRVLLNVERIRWEGGVVDSRHWMVAIQDLFPIAT